MASRIPDDLRAALLKKGHSQEELTPFQKDELPATGGISADAEIDFSYTEFRTLSARYFIFPNDTSFFGATFSGRALFRNAMSDGYANFGRATDYG